VLLVTLLSTYLHGTHPWYEYTLIAGWELIGGAVFGLLTGLGGAWLIRKAALPSSGLYPLAVLSLAFLAYAGAVALHASGFAAVYLAALVLGNARLPHRRSILSFVEGLAWLAQIGLFVMLGLLAWPGRIGLDTLVYALVIGVALTFLARPLAVLVSALPFRLPVREGTFLSWAGLRGAIPIVLATIPLAADVPVPNAELLFDIVFVLVIALTLAQGPTLPWVARRLGVAVGDRVADLEVEAGPLDMLDADLLEIKILATSKLAGVEVGELRLPPGASVSLLVRDGRPIVPDLSTPLRAGDDVLVVTPRRVRDATERRLRAVSREGRLARWRYRR
jgi:potassium/hydrogen antiporter